jgi:transcription antitermination factor NusA-like protein/predicted RNA-binding protein YlxR (DUF448 family)
MIQQSDARYTLLDLGRVEALLPQAEQVPFERPEPNTRLKAYIVEVRRTSKGPQIVVSRTHPGLIKRLFELEVPEIADGVVEIKACAREPGHRTKIAVWSNDVNVDPVGACVGARGARVRMVVNELRGEKIDIVPFSDDPGDFVAKALSPAKVKEVRIDEETGTAELIVPVYQLSLCRREGQNARPRAAHGWRVDIKGETQLVEEAQYAATDWAEGEWSSTSHRRAGSGRRRWVHRVGRAVERGRRGDGGSRGAPTAGGPAAGAAVTGRGDRRCGRSGRHRRRTSGRGGAAGRTCVGCRTAVRRPLVRLTPARRQRPGGRSVDGRGAWVGPALGCLEAASRRLGRAMHANAPLPLAQLTADWECTIRALGRQTVAPDWCPRVDVPVEQPG